MTAEPKKRLAKNTLYLYILSLSSQVISLLTIPYQTRVLSPETYGVIGFFTGIMAVVALCLNFGFLYSATEQVALNSENNKKISELYTATWVAKFVIFGILVLACIVLVFVFDVVRENLALFVLFFLANATASFMPDFLYRGLEQMRTITIRAVAIRLLSASMIFIFLKSEQDVLIIPGSLLLGNILALAYCIYYGKTKLAVSFVPITWASVRKSLSRGAPFFVSRIASTVYQSGSAIVLGAMYPGQPQVGLYNASDKLLTAVKQVSSPIADSIYPYMVKNKDYRLAIKLMLIAAPFIAACAVIGFLFADELAIFVFGEDYREAGDIIKCLIPAMAVIFPTYIICFPILVPMRLSKFANISNVIGMTSQLVILVLLFAADNLNVFTVCLGASFSEVLVFFFRLIVMIKYRDRMKRDL